MKLILMKIACNQPFEHNFSKNITLEQSSMIRHIEYWHKVKVGDHHNAHHINKKYSSPSFLLVFFFRLSLQSSIYFCFKYNNDL